MNCPYRTIVQATKFLLERTPRPLELARELDLDDSHVYKARAGDYTPTYREKLQELGLIRPPRERIRLAGDVPEEFREKFREAADGADMTTGAYMVEVWETREMLIEALKRQRQGLFNLVDMAIVPASYNNPVHIEISFIDAILTRVKQGE